MFTLCVSVFADEEDKLVPNPDPTKPTTEEQTEKVVEYITQHAEENHHFDINKPIWNREIDREDGHDSKKIDGEVNLKISSLVSSILSKGNLWIITVVAVIALGGVVTLIIVKKKNTVEK